MPVPRKKKGRKDSNVEQTGDFGCPGVGERGQRGEASALDGVGEGLTGGFRVEGGEGDRLTKKPRDRASSPFLGRRKFRRGRTGGGKGGEITRDRWPDSIRSSAFSKKKNREQKANGGGRGSLPGGKRWLRPSRGV